MCFALNELQQPVGLPVKNWQPADWPSGADMEGMFCRVQALDPNRHAESLYESFAADRDGRNWTYLPYGPFSDYHQFRGWLDTVTAHSDPRFYVVLDRLSDRAVGMASYLRIQPAAGAIEVGHIHFSPVAQRSRLSSESMYLMMRHVFEDLGYRRYEWKCNALNDASCRAARRLGFVAEGVFRQADVVKGRNRDTAWFAILDHAWPEIRAGFEAWLHPENFRSDGRQRSRLCIRQGKADC